MNTTSQLTQLKNKLPSFYGVIAEDLQKTEGYIENLLRSENKDIEENALYLLNNGGKRLRPALLLLSGHCGEYHGEKLIPMAAAVEIIHMASLVHDDIVDKTPLRRGKPTIASEKGNVTALFTGNFMLTKAISAVLATDEKNIRKIAVDTASEMCRGEFLQLEAIDAPNFSTDHYMRRIRRKTANLISAACEIGAYLGNAEEHIVTAMKEFGDHIGVAFQITDDILDYTAENKAFGKALGSDLAEGLATMPLICAWQKGEKKRLIEELFRQSRESEKAVNTLIEIVKENDGPQNAAHLAEEHIMQARECLKAVKNSEIRAGFEEIADFILTRDI